MKNLGVLFSALALLVIASCSSNKYHTTRVQNLDFEQYKTYGWLPPVDSLSKDYFNNDIAKHNIMTTANKEIESRGLTYTKENPDVLFRYVAIVNNKSRMVYSSFHNSWGGPWGWYRPWGYYGFYSPSYPVGKERIRYGHLIIEAVDRNKKTVVWQARGTTEVDNPERAINGLPKLIQGIMKQYPLHIE
jgi:hypothetical protein